MLRGGRVVFWSLSLASKAAARQESWGQGGELADGFDSSVICRRDEPEVRGLAQREVPAVFGVRCRLALRLSKERYSSI